MKAKRSSHAPKEWLVSFFTQPAARFDKGEWSAGLNNLNLGWGFGHLVLTLVISALIVFVGLSVEWLVRRSTQNLRRQILDTASPGRLHFLGRVFSRLLLNAVGMGTYILATFVLWAIFYDEEMEEGGRGGSRIGTLLVLLRKFILSVLFVIVSLIVLSSLGLDKKVVQAGAIAASQMEEGKKKPQE